MEKDEWYWGLSPLIRKNIEEAERYEKAGGGLTPSIEEYDDGYIPEGCRACGGDYPRCRQGCALFDED
jgi:hypothetical protein